MNLIDKNNTNNTQINYSKSINNISTKKMLINYIYDNIDLSKYNYSLIDSIETLKPVYDNEYYLTPNFNGANVLLIFCKIGNIYFSYMIKRKLLTYKKEELDYSTITIENVKLRLGIDIYKGTIFDGICIHNNEDKDTFIINDIYLFLGVNYVNIKTKEKLMLVESYLEIKFKNNDTINTININTNKLFNLDNLNEMLINLANTPNLQIKGFDIIPEYSGTKLVFLYAGNFNNNLLNNNKQNIIKKKNNNTKNKLLPLCVLNKDNIITAKIVKKGNEIFKLYLSSIEILNNKKIIKYISIGIANLPTLESSELCENLYIKYPLENILVDCILSYNKKFWIPIKHNTEKSYADDINILNLLKK